MSATSGYYAPAGQGWRLANCLVTLAHELADVYGDQLTCLGTVGDVAHAAEAMGSDHNAFIRDPAAPSIGIVRAIDFGGSDAVLKGIRQHLWELYAAQDQRLYVFGYAKGCSDNLINNWGLPFGVHVDTGDAGHLHVSVTQMNGYSPSPGGYVAAIDSTNSWGFGGLDPSGHGNQEDEVTQEEIAAIAAAAAKATVDQLMAYPITVPPQWSATGQAPYSFVASQTLSVATVLFNAQQANPTGANGQPLTSAQIAAIATAVDASLHIPTKEDIAKEVLDEQAERLQS